MATRFVTAIAEICHVQVSDLNINGHYEFEAQKRLVNDYLLPKCLGVGGSEKRFPHISDEFMSFMAEFGHECIVRDKETGELLMELAMQRISCGAIAVNDYDFIGSLPLEYQRYTAAYDEPALMSQACWDFIEKNIQFCIEGLTKETWRQHAENILWSLLQNIGEDGSLLNDYVWNEGLINKSLTEVYSWVMHVAQVSFTPYDLVIHLAPTWKKHLRCFKNADGVIEWTDKSVRQAFAESTVGEQYFKFGTIRLLKIFGVYDRVLIAYILRDLRRMPGK